MEGLVLVFGYTIEKKSVKSISWFKNVSGFDNLSDTNKIAIENLTSYTD